jgi:hypothetical protein
MKRRFLIAAAALVASVTLGVTPARAADPAWLLGDWEFVPAPGETSTKTDYLVFAPGGQVTSIDHTGRSHAGLYRVEGHEVLVSVPLRGQGRALRANLTYKPQTRQLIYQASINGQTGTYVRSKR